jgi:putative ABC transport system permease protein
MRVRVSGKEEFLPVSMLWVDHDFIKTMGLNISEGRDFSSLMATDKTEAYIINRAARKLLDLESPVGEKLEWPSADGLRKGPIIGVVEDFHYASLKEDIEPLVMLIMPYYGYLSLKINSQEIGSTLQSIEKTTKALLPLQPFDYQFLDENINRQYRDEEVFSRVLQLFTILSVVISCLGLFALSAFSAGQRVKEIAVRKVLGASEIRLVLLLAQGYIKQVIWALLLGFPIAYLGTKLWLEDFAYHITMDWWIFALVALISVLTSLFTVSFQAIKASLVNPVTSLRE